MLTTPSTESGMRKSEESRNERKIYASVPYIKGISERLQKNEVRDCGKLIESLKERGIKQMCCFGFLLLFNEMQMSVRRYSVIPTLEESTKSI